MHLNTTSSLYQLEYLMGQFYFQPTDYTLPTAGNTSNGSDPGSKVPDEEDLDVNTDIYSKVTVTIVYLSLFVVGTVGNSITAYTLVRKKSLQNLQSTVHYHLASLAFSDLLIFLLCMPIELYNFIWVHHPWAFGNDICKGYYFLRDACTYATALNIASLSVERYMAICHPFKAKSIMSRSRTKKFISGIWVASFLLAIPMIFTMGEVYKLPQDPDSLICTNVVDTPTLKSVIQVSHCAGFSFLFLWQLVETVPGGLEQCLIPRDWGLVSDSKQSRRYFPLCSHKLSAVTADDGRFLEHAELSVSRRSPEPSRAAAPR